MTIENTVFAIWHYPSPELLRYAQVKPTKARAACPLTVLRTPQGERGKKGGERSSFLLPLWEKVAHLSVSDRRRMRGNVEAKNVWLVFYPSPVSYAATLSHKGRGKELHLKAAS